MEPKLNFDLKTLKESGQLALLQVSDKYGAMLFAYGPELIVVPNGQLNQVLNEETLPVETLLAKGKNQTESTPIAYLNIVGDLLFL